MAHYSKYKVKYLKRQIVDTEAKLKAGSGGPVITKERVDYLHSLKEELKEQYRLKLIA